MKPASSPAAIYQQLADLSAETLRLCRERDWEGFAALGEREAALLAQLQAFGSTSQAASPELDHIEALIRQTLCNQREAQILLVPWREEIAAQLRSVGSSKKLANAYGGRGARS